MSQQPIVPEARCPVCGSPIADLPAIRCPSCDGPHHTECWNYAGRCATFGCSGHPASAPRRDSGENRTPPAAAPASIGSVAVKTALMLAALIGLRLAVELRAIPAGPVVSPSTPPTATPGPADAQSSPLLAPRAEPAEPSISPEWKANLPGIPLPSCVVWPPRGDGPMVFGCRTAATARSKPGVTLEAREPSSGRCLWSTTVPGLTGDGDFAAVTTPDRVTIVTREGGAAVHELSSGALVRRFPPRRPATRIDVLHARSGYALVGGAGLVHEIGTHDLNDAGRHRWTMRDHGLAEGVRVTSSDVESDGVLIGGGDRTVVLRRPDGTLSVVDLSRGAAMALGGDPGDPPVAAQVKLPLVATIGKSLCVRNRNDGRAVLTRSWPARPVRMESLHGLIYVLRDDGGLVGIRPESGTLIFAREGVTDFQLDGGEAVVLYDDSRLERIDPTTGDSRARFLLDGCETREPPGGRRRGPWLRVAGPHAVVIRSSGPEAHELRCFRIFGG